MSQPLVFADTSAAGYGRVAHGRGFRWLMPDGSALADREIVARLRGVGLPPAYRDCWYCTDPRGHIQAMGTDARGRRQYRYHPEFRAAQEELKFEACAAFGERLPRLRRRVERDLARRDLSRERVLAAVVRLLDLGRIRVGSERYARANRSFGATTLRTRHAEVRGQRLMLAFRAKGGVERRVALSDRALARTVRACQDLSGQHLFAWEDPSGERRVVASSDVNAYLRETMGDGATAKSFRTWWGSVIALEAILGRPPAGTVKDVVARVSRELGNTPAVARKSYIHPRLFEQLGRPPLSPLPRATRWLSRPERALLLLLTGQPEASLPPG